MAEKMVHMSEEEYQELVSKEEDWFEPEGRFFIKRKNVNWVTVQIPDFMVDKLKSSGIIK